MLSSIAAHTQYPSPIDPWPSQAKCHRDSALQEGHQGLVHLLEGGVKRNMHPCTVYPKTLSQGKMPKHRVLAVPIPSSTNPPSRCKHANLNLDPNSNYKCRSSNLKGETGASMQVRMQGARIAVVYIGLMGLIYSLYSPYTLRGGHVQGFGTDLAIER